MDKTFVSTNERYKRKYFCSYKKLLYNLQKKYLNTKYREYNKIPIKLREIFEDCIFEEVDSLVQWYINYFNDN